MKCECAVTGHCTETGLFLHISPGSLGSLLVVAVVFMVVAVAVVVVVVVVM